MRVTVVPYDPTWPERFEVVRAALVEALADVPHLGIEHVGSTSVPGLAAKPVIDVDVVVAAGHLDAAIEAMAVAGYEHLGDLGVEGRHAFRASTEDELAAITRNVYVCVEGALSLRNHLAVRDTLRADPELRAAYAAVKLQLAGQELADMGDYIEGKSEVLQRVLAASGLTEAERDAILAVNRKPGS
ncbi:GrpB-like predicted nucleotidyltransferase (UPF0157 family) [Nocardioides sp. J9]|uniref:GrpB family protein n=1 Tax=Nocardioides sp. J9 TaxID=935844 RepID=UPI00119CC06B|nr:GrpB family protein [Nocardioides sp. J9]TWH00678.1 GrpB-like predicted nucleotidyltransferase (UPF0157 family) [Nocardioides sp. J9]